MLTELKVLGPFEIPCENGGAVKFIDNAQRKEFLGMIYDDELWWKQGCYVFALRAGKGFSPWYVGKATKGMGQECMGPHQLQHYNAVLSKGYKGTPAMFFVTRDGAKNKISMRICDEMESFLIQTAFYKNPDLRNVQKAKGPEWTIDGVVRGERGKPTNGELGFRKMMGL